MAACRPSCTGVVLVVPRGSGVEVAHGADVVVEGGATRAESVRLGLTAVPGRRGDRGARRRPPAGLAACSRAVIEAVLTDGAGGAVPGIPVSDTIKVVDGADNVTRTLDRASLVAVQTPQAFGADLLRRAQREEEKRRMMPRSSRHSALPCGSSPAIHAT